MLVCPFACSWIVLSLWLEGNGCGPKMAGPFRERDDRVYCATLRFAVLFGIVSGGSDTYDDVMVNDVLWRRMRTGWGAIDDFSGCGGIRVGEEFSGRFRRMRVKLLPIFMLMTEKGFNLDVDQNIWTNLIKTGMQYQFQRIAEAACLMSKFFSTVQDMRKHETYIKICILKYLLSKNPSKILWKLELSP